jgi:AraC family transcriptional regulator
MEWPERMNAAIEYIEDNLADEIDFNEAAKRACCSTFHFQRIFFVVNGITLAEYARRRRLTLAARELSSGNTKVIDIAMKYGYDSPDAFTRAFRNVHGITPQAARAPGVKLVAFPRVSFHIELKGGNDMDYRIMDKPAFEVIGKSRKSTTVNKANYKELPAFWDEFKSTKNYQVLNDLITKKPGVVTGSSMLGVCIPNEKKNMEEFLYAIGIEKPEKKVPVGFEVIHVPAATWAIFDVTGPAEKAVQDTTDRIYGEWFPSTGYEEASVPELEVYSDGDMDSPNYHCQIWIPIIKKKKSDSPKKK